MTESITIEILSNPKTMEALHRSDLDIKNGRVKEVTSIEELLRDCSVKGTDDQTKPFDKCPVCDGELVEKQVEKLLRGGDNTAVIRVRAYVCLHCGERLYLQETVKRFEEIRRKSTDRTIISGNSIRNRR
ncbi:MAG: YgiT-type zinc finger protein [Candidatus Methanoperedens sp.]|nr:YgiT-type zinc finger protein [Candidatus Methanoperedens sp.]MCZ7399504.1 YgiT-type zinc finger protein [Candidatus Methanoperedens sp.]